MSNEHESSLRELTETHERLCAYVLGEGTSAERADLERELMRSPELRAQHDEIARTIGMVKEAMTSGETMSPQATQFVVSAANASKKSTWQAVPWMRLAAGLGAVALGFAIVQRSNGRFSGESSTGFEVARVEGLPKAEEASSGKYRGPGDAAVPGGGGGGHGNEREKDAEQGETRKGATVRFGAEGHDPSQARTEPQSQPMDQVMLAKENKKSQGGLDSDGGEPRGRLVTAGGLQPERGDVDAKSALATDKSGGSKGDAMSPAIAGTELVAHDAATQFGGAGGALPAPTMGHDAANAVKNGQLATTDLYAGVPAEKPASGVRGLAANDPASMGAVRDRGSSKDSAAEDLRRQAGAPARVAVARPTAPSPVGAGSSGTAIPSSRSGPATGAPSTPASGGSSTEAVRLAVDAPRSTPMLQQVEARSKDGKPDSAKELRGELLVLEEAKQRADSGGFLADLGGGSSSDFFEEEQSVPYYKLAPADQQIYLDRECRRILVDCRPRPNERPRDMFFRFWGDNPFEVAALDAQSTFSADVDTASYALARRYLNEGNVPEKAQIRTEEFVNYFKSDVPAPTNGVFAIHTDLTPSRFSTDTTRQMMRVVLRGKDLSKVERKPMNLTFVVDVSGSMREQNRLEMVKHAIRLLVTQLDQYDKIAIVKFSTDAQRVLGLTPVSDRAAIESAIMPLAPEGSTNSNAGLELGYGIALGGLDPNATNRVVFLSDGVANVGETDPAKIAERVKPMREKGIYLNTIGVGMNNHNDVLLEQLADKADGMCAYIDTPDEAKKQLVDNFSGAFQPIARDVKIQVEFDPMQVLRYRLLGYENRAIADADFRNDKVDAGELGAGHQVTALYEIERQSGGVGASEKPLATVRVRWKEPRNFGTNPEQDSATEISQTVSSGDAKSFEAAGQSYRKVVMAAQFAELLRRSVHARGDSLDDLLNEALKLQREIPNDAEFNEFVLLVSKSKDLVLRTMPVCDELCQAIDQVREFEYRRQQLASIQRDMDQATLDALRRQNDELEARLRDLVRRRLENQVR